VLRIRLHPVDLVHVDDPHLPAGTDPETLRVPPGLAHFREESLQPLEEVPYFGGAAIRVI
jgi:hypothetical protein